MSYAAMTKKPFHIYFKRLLEERGLNATDFGKLVRKKQPYISLLLNGKRKAPKPSAESEDTLTMPQVIAALSCTDEESRMLMEYSYERQLGTEHPLDYVQTQHTNVLKWDDPTTAVKRLPFRVQAGSRSYVVELPFAWDGFAAGDALILNPEVKPGDGEVVVVDRGSGPELTRYRDEDESAVVAAVVGRLTSF